MRSLFSKKQKESREQGRAPGSKTRRILVCSDLHCGHLAGLTPPEFDARPHAFDIPGAPPAAPTSGEPLTADQLLEMNAQEPGAGTLLHTRALYEMRRFCWEWFHKEAQALAPFDAAIWNGDLIDGKGDKSGSTELLTADRSTQAEIAAAVLDTIGAPLNFLAFGTPYHGGNFEDWERETAAMAKNVVKLGGSDWIDVNGLIIGYRHHCGRSSIPHGPYTPLAKERLWELLWAERGEYPGSDILIRSHVHYHAYCGGPGWLAMTTPALQGYASKIARRTLGVVDFGFVVIDVLNKESFTWHALTVPLRSAPSAIVVL